MKKKRLLRHAFQRIVAFVLATAFIMSGMNVTSWNVKAADDIVLTASAVGAPSNNNQAEIEIAAPSGYETIQSLSDAGYTKLEIAYSISSHTQGGTGTPGMQPYYAYGSDWTYYTGGVWKNFSDGNTGKVSLDLAGGNGKTDKLQRFGLQLCNVSAVNASVTSAKLIYSGSAGGSSSTSSSGSGGDTSVPVDGLSATVKQKSGNSDWAEYNYSITNGTSSSVKGLKVVIPFSGTVNNLKSWGCTVAKVDNTIVIKHTAEIAANSTYSCLASDEIKFGFAGGASLGTPVVSVLTADDNASQLKYPLKGTTQELAADETPVGKHGALHLKEVSGYSTPIIVDKNDNPFQLRGASTHGMQWDAGGPFVNKASFQSLRDEWGVNMVRLVSYVTQYNGYTVGGQQTLDSKIQAGVQAATDLGMYAIVDWHIHVENPHDTKAQAVEFFKKYATMYKDYDNVIFEICNEPVGVQWYDGSGGDLYSYCKEIAQVIRDCGSNSLIICGTNTWSQDVDDVARKPLKNDGFDDILYTFHFYSGTHYDDKMNKVRTAIAAGTPIFVTEFGVCDASGNGGYDTDNADAWIKLCDQNNISYACWSLSNKDESASYLLSSCNKTTGGWLEEDLSTTGIWLVNTYRAHEEAEKEKEDPTKVSKVTLDKTTLSLGKGEAVTLTATISPSTAEDKSVTWNSSNTNVATVDEAGKVTAVAAGSATITVTTTDGKKTATCKVTVTAPGITLNKNTLTLKSGESATLTATVTGITDKTVTWSSSDTDVASVKDGKITAVAGGSATITAKAGSGVNEVTATCKVTVTKNSPVVTVPASISVKAGSGLSDITFDTDDFTASVPGEFTWKTTDKTFSVKDNNTKVTVTFTPEDIAAYDSVDKEITILVTKKKYDSVPEAPTLSSATANTVTLVKVSGVTPVQYGLKQGTVYKWQDENTFTGLSAYTTYEFAMRYSETDIYEASGAGKTLKVTTFLNDTDKYIVDLDRLTEEGYVEAHGGTISYDADKNLVTLNEGNKTYTIQGSNKEIDLQCSANITVKLEGAELKSLAGSGGDTTVQLKNDSVVMEGITAEGNVIIQNGGVNGVGSLTVSSSETKAALDATKVTIEGGKITAAGAGAQAAIQAGTVELFGGTVIVNADKEPPIVADTVVLDGGQVSSNASTIYSTAPVDKDGNTVDFCQVYYVNGSESTEASVKKGSEITLPPLPAKKGYKANGWKLAGESVIFAPGEAKIINEDVTYSADYTEITGKLKVTVSEEDNLTAGYKTDAGVTVTIKNETTVPIDEIKFTLKNSKEFTIDKASITDLGKGASTEVKVALKNGLGVGNYETGLTISCVAGEYEAIEETVTRVVERASVEKPDAAPEILSVTKDSVTLVPVSATDKKIEYGIKQDGTYTWQASNKFTELKGYTTYTFAIRYAETDSTTASEASDSVEATTLMDDSAKYTVDVTNLDNKEYVDAHDGSISYDAIKNEVTLIEADKTYTITGNNPEITVVVKEKATVILDNAKIKALESKSDITIILKGTSSIVSSTSQQPAVKAEGSVTISNVTEGTGTVTITGGDDAAGIMAGEVIITGGTVTITGGKDAAGIVADKVAVSGGTVAVTGQGDKPAIKADDIKLDVAVKTINGTDYKEPVNPDDSDGSDDPVNPDKTTEKPGNTTGSATTTQTKDDSSTKKEEKEDEDDGKKIKPALLCSNLLLQRGKSIRLKTNDDDVEITKVAYANKKSKKIVKVSSSGKITGKKTGNASLKVTYEYDDTSYTKKVKVKVQKNPVVSLTKKTISLTMKRNKKVNLVNPSNMLSTKGMKFSTSNSRYAKVSSSGLVHARRKGSVIIKVKIGKTNYTVKIKVK